MPKCLRRDREIESSVLDAYVELLKLRESRYFHSKVLVRPCKRFFLGMSYLMTIAAGHCTDLEMHPNCKTPERMKDQEQFYLTYQDQHFGPPIQLCDVVFVALFPVCTGSHWFLFVVDLERMKLLLIDHLREHVPPHCDLRKAYAKKIFVMEKLLPCMLHFLELLRFAEDGFMDVKFITDRPKQQVGSDCGMYVCKYMDAILGGISLKDARWHPVHDVLTFQ